MIYLDCSMCKWVDKNLGSCLAYPKRIPFIFISGQAMHDSRALGQENDLIFESASPYKLEFTNLSDFPNAKLFDPIDYKLIGNLKELDIYRIGYQDEKELITLLTLNSSTGEKAQIVLRSSIEDNPDIEFKDLSIKNFLKK